MFNNNDFILKIFLLQKIGKILGSSEYENVEENQKTFLSLLTEDERTS